jgi:Fe-S-cluster containining protein
MFLKPKVPQHQDLIQRIEDYLDDKTTLIPSLGKGRFEFQAYKAALVVDVVHQKIDEIINPVREQLQDTEKPVTCGKECSACCYQPISGWLPETLLIGEYLKTNQEVREKFMNKYPIWRSKINKEDFNQGMNTSLVKGSNNVQAAVDSFSYEKLACPFLDNKNCSIYEVRPIACRQLLSVDDPVKCEGTELVQYLGISSLNLLIHNKVTPLFSSMLGNLGINVMALGLTSITSFEYVRFGKDYIELCAKDPLGIQNA